MTVYRVCCLLTALVLGSLLAMAISIMKGPAVAPVAVLDRELPVLPDSMEPGVPGLPTPIEPELEDLPGTVVDLAPPMDVEPVDPEMLSNDDERIEPEAELYWHENYEEAVREAKQDRRMLLIYFHDLQETPARHAFETRTLDEPNIRSTLAADFVLAKLPRTATSMSEGKEITLLEHPAFAEMLGRQGIAVLDFAHPKQDYYGHVVSTFPFTPGKFYRSEAVSIILDLPPGTLTQRTMIYAVRIHPEAPASAHGKLHSVLANEANLHSTYQAAILNQGHHNWDNRFQRINSQLPSGVLAQEVVAESWPNESLVEACVDCVDSWRQSPGHWNAVRSRHPMFGFDIKRGRNGIWYATGIFGQR